MRGDGAVFSLGGWEEATVPVMSLLTNLANLLYCTVVWHKEQVYILR